MSDFSPIDERLPEGAAQFVDFVAEWLEQFAPLIDALTVLRTANDPKATEDLMNSAPLKRYMEAWRLWEEWSIASGEDVDLALMPFLGEPRMAWLWFALYGARVTRRPDGSYVGFGPPF